MSKWDDQLLADRHVEFTSTGVDKGTFAVIDFKGFEGISRLFEYKVDLISEKPLDPGAVLNKPATLTLVYGEKRIELNGIVTRIDQLKQLRNASIYKVVLQPRLAWLNLYQTNEVYVQKSFPEVLEGIFKDTKLLSGQDYELALYETYPIWTQITQYKETNFNFISRWMEFYGIYYYFEHKDGRDKIIVTDGKGRHEKGGKFTYSPDTGMQGDITAPVFTDFSSEFKVLPHDIVVTDYNYRKATMPIEGKAIVSDNGVGTVYRHGEHVKTPDQAKKTAKILAEELKCREYRFTGTGGGLNIRAGYCYDLDKHYIESFNTQYIAVEVAREGTQGGIFRGGGATADTEKVLFKTTVKCLRFENQYRPERITPKPRIVGTMNAIIDAEGSGKNAELDEYGRYKVKLPFGSDKRPGKASRWIRMAQPYGGSGHGMHFPLLKGTEVLLTFIDGDPDRPIISGVVPNSVNMSLVTSKNKSTNMINTAAGNMFALNDTDGKEHLLMKTPGGKSSFAIGSSIADAEEDTAGLDALKQELEALKSADEKDQEKIAELEKEVAALEEENKQDTIAGSEWESEDHWGVFKSLAGKGIKMSTEDNYVVGCKGDSAEVVKGHDYTTTIGDEKSYVGGDVTEEIKGNSTGTTYGNVSDTTYGSENSVIMGAEDSVVMGASNSVVMGTDTSMVIGVATDMVVGATVELALAGSIDINAVAEMDIEVMDLDIVALEVGVVGVGVEVVGAEVGVVGAGVELVGAEASIVGASMEMVGVAMELAGVEMAVVAADIGVKVITSDSVMIESSTKGMSVSLTLIGLEVTLLDLKEKALETKTGETIHT